jgi:hypothetical protein
MLLLVITGPMTMISRSNSSTAFATEQITAFFLAQEGLELVQMQRDKLLLEYFEGTRPAPWAAFETYFDECTDADGCRVEVESTVNPNVVVGDCNVLTNCRLKLDSTVSSTVRPSFRHSGSDPNSLFTRVITMDFTADREVRVVATVTWRTGTLIRSQQVESVTYLFNIYDLP